MHAMQKQIHMLVRLGAELTGYNTSACLHLPFPQRINHVMIMLHLQSSSKRQGDSLYLLQFCPLVQISIYSMTSRYRIDYVQILCDQCVTQAPLNCILGSCPFKFGPNNYFVTLPYNHNHAYATVIVCEQFKVLQSSCLNLGCGCLGCTPFLLSLIMVYGLLSLLYVPIYSFCVSSREILRIFAGCTLIDSTILIHFAHKQEMKLMQLCFSYCT